MKQLKISASRGPSVTTDTCR